MAISDFYSKAYDRDFSRDFQMRVVDLGPIRKDDNIFIRTATLPGYSITNHQVPFMGLQFNVPGSGTFPNSASWQVTVLADQNLDIRYKFIEWQRNVFNAFAGDTDNSVGSRTVNAYNPKRDEVGLLTVFDKYGKEVRGIKLVGVYPVSVDDLSYDMKGSGAPQEFNVTLAYQWWEPVRVGNVLKG